MLPRQIFVSFSFWGGSCRPVRVLHLTKENGYGAAVPRHSDAKSRSDIGIGGCVWCRVRAKSLKLGIPWGQIYQTITTIQTDSMPSMIV